MPTQEQPSTHASHVPVHTGAPPEVAPRTPWLALAVVLVAAFMDLLDVSIVAVAAPAIVADLGANESALQWMVAGYTLALGAGLVSGGRIGDLYGRRRAFLLGLAAFAVTSALCALAPTPTFLVVMRVLQGLAAGLMVPQVLGIIRASFEPAARAKALGAYGAVLGLASVAGPLLGGLLVDADLAGLGWRAIFWVNVPVAVLGLVIGARVLRESRATDKVRLDIPGAVLAAAVAVLLLLPLIQGRDWGWPWWSFALLGLAVPVAAAFVRREARLGRSGGQPLLDPALLKVRAFSAGLVVVLFFFGAIGAFFLLLVLYLQLGTGRSALATGLIMLPYAVGSIITSGVGVALAARAGRVLLIAGALVLASSQALMWAVVSGNENPAYWLLALPLLVGGLGLGLAAPSLINVVLDGVPTRDAGAAGGVLTTVSQIGAAAGVALLGIVYFDTLGDEFAAGAAPLGAYTAAFTSVLPWLFGAYLAAAALMLALPARTRTDEPA